MNLNQRHRVWRFVAILGLGAGLCLAQQEPAAQPSPQTEEEAPSAPAAVAAAAAEAAVQKTPARGPNPKEEQPKRILGLMPNYRAVSAGAIPPPPTLKEAFKIATQNSFDYSAFIFVGITSLTAWGVEWPHDAPTHPELGSGLSGYGRYYWRGFLDKADGNYLVDFAFPTLFHEDERYYALGEGGFWKRAVYAATRVVITPDYHGHNTINAAEIFGRGLSQGISGFYYPAPDRTPGALAVKFGWAVGRDALTNVIREFWPDISRGVSHHVLHRQP